jgi:hypothetical protein
LRLLAVKKNANDRGSNETLAYKKPMDEYQESIKLNQGKAKAS